jgi:hypothetical protein
LDGVAFAANPFRVIRRGASQGVVEQLLTEAAHLNRNGMVAGHRQVSKASPQLPGNFGVEMRQN